MRTVSIVVMLFFRQYVQYSATTQKEALYRQALSLHQTLTCNEIDCVMMKSVADDRLREDINSVFDLIVE